MRISVKKERTNTEQTIEFTETTVKQLLKLIDVNPETVLVVKNSEVLTEIDEVTNEDHLRLLSVISGG